MPWAGQPVHPPPPPAGPALFLYPTNDSFIPKMISLAPSGNRVKIGRQTNTKTVPGERNGYFDSKVLSRQHAEVWEEGGKIFIKDVKSSNGTFVNGERLSVEGIESEPWELKTEDRVEFGIDIVGEDNKAIIHHKVAATVYCVITPEDYAQLSMHHPPLQQQHHPQHSNGAYHLQGQQQRRPSLQQTQSPIGLGGLGGGPGLGLSGRSGKSGLTFDHILNRLQNELQKSRDTGSELNSLASVMTDISENLSGGAAPPSIPANHALPPVRPPPQSEHPRPSSDVGVDITSLQSQLMQTQSALATHADKVKTLESVITEHEHVKHELVLMRELMDQRKVEIETLIGHSRLQINGDHEKNIHDTDSDAEEDRRSILTTIPEDADSGRTSAISDYSRDERDRYEDEEDRARSEALGRPRTPEPHGMGMGEDDDEEVDANHRLTRQFNSSTLMSPASKFNDQRYGLSLQSGSDLALDVPRPTAEELHSQNAFLSTRLETLAQQLDTALNLSRTLHGQAEAAQHNIELLEAKVRSLEAYVETTKSQQAQQLKENEAVNNAEVENGTALSKQQLVLTEVWESWRQRIEGQWRTEREEWDAERSRLQEAVRDWEARVAHIEERDQLRNEQSNELLGALQRERDEAIVAWKMLEPMHAIGDGHSSDEAVEPQLRVTNGTTAKLGTKARRSNPSGSSPKATGKPRKRRSSPSGPVATPPHSPPMNGEAITERSSDASGSRSTSPEPTNRDAVVDAFANGHIKPELFPLSPAPSVRHGGTRAGSTTSDLDAGDDLNIAPSIGHLPPPSPNPSRSRGGVRRLRESPLPYISASVVFIGLAAWAFTSRAKE